MNLRLVPTPIRPEISWPPLRTGAIDPALFDAFVPAPGLESVLARLRDPDALVVTTGQQPALFTGPLYTIHKALSAAALARILERRWRRPVVPVFWVAGDDHDLAEANHASWLAADGRVATGTLPAPEGNAGALPLYRQPLGPSVAPILASIAADLAPLEFAKPTLAWLERHFQPEATFAESFAHAVAELLAPAGVVCLQTTHPCVKEVAAGHMMRALELTDELNHDLAARARELESLGIDPGVEVDERATLVMFEGAMGRDRLLRDGSAFTTRRSAERLGASVADLRRYEAQRFSPNVLLRPVIESALLPTVAYVAGPAELRYLELAAPVYERLGVPRQMPVPRWSGIMVERRVDRVLEKFGVALGDLLSPAGRLEYRLVRDQLPPEVLAALAELRNTISRNYEAIAGAAAEIDPTLVSPMHRIRARALAEVDEAETKLVRHMKRRQETELRQLAQARASVFSNDKPQERVLTVASFLAREGPSLIPTLTDAFEAWYAAVLQDVRDPAQPLV